MDESKKCIKDNYNIVVNFSDHPGYYSAYKYVSKEDKDVLRSPNHPTSVVEPRPLHPDYMPSKFSFIQGDN